MEGCDRVHSARGYCSTHYRRWVKHGDPLLGAQERRVCVVEGCDDYRSAHGYCSMHRQRVERHGDPLYVRPKPPPIITSTGYRMLYMPDHPNAYRNGRVLEHHVVMSEILGRPLRKGESVHHLNGVRDDNRPENLELWASLHPAGQRVEDLREFAREVRNLYGI